MKQKDKYQNELIKQKDEYQNELMKQKDKYQNELMKQKDEILQLKTDLISRQLIIEKNEQAYNEKIKLYESFNNDNKQTLSSTIDKLASKSSSNSYVNNQNKYNIIGRVDLSPENISSHIDKYTMELYDKGISGLVEWTKLYFLTNEKGELMFDIADRSRRICVYHNKEGIMIRDEKIEKLKNSIRPILLPKIKEHHKTKCAELELIEDCEEASIMMEKNRRLKKTNDSFD